MNGLNKIKNSDEYVVKAKLKGTDEYVEMPYSLKRESFSIDFSSIEEINIIRCDNACQDAEQDEIITIQDADQCDPNDVGSC